MVPKEQRDILSGTLYEKGLVTFPVENLDFVSILQRTLTETFGVVDLSMLHRQIRPNDLNSWRINAFDQIKNIRSFKCKLFIWLKILCLFKLGSSK